MTFLKRQGPLFLAFLSGMLLLCLQFIPHQRSQDIQTWTGSWIGVIAGAALPIGIASLLHLHIGKIRRRVSGWGYSMVACAAFGAALVTGLGFGGYQAGTALGWMVEHMLTPLQATMFSVLGFYIASAAFRAFRARSFEAGVLLVSAVIIICGQIPVGYQLWHGAPDLAAEVLAVPNTAAKRALNFGISLGVIATSLRILFGIERSYLGGGD